MEGVSNGPFLRTTPAFRPSSVAHPGKVPVSVRGYIHRLWKASLAYYILTNPRPSIGCRRHFRTSTEREVHHVSKHLEREPRKPLVPPLPLKLLQGSSHRFESPLPALPARCFTWDRGWYIDVVANPSASSDMGSPNVPASEGVSTRLSWGGCAAKNQNPIRFFLTLLFRRSIRTR
jgi:hypothetical protein